MATEVLLGKNTYLYVNTGTKNGDGQGGSETWTEVDLAKDLTKDQTKAEIDITNRESARGGYTAKAQGLKEFKISFDANRAALGVTPNAGIALVEAAFYSDTTEEFVIADGNINTGTAVPGTFAVCFVGGGNETQPLNEAVTISYDLTNVGAPINGAWTTGTFTPS